MSNTKLTQIKEAKEAFQALLELSGLLCTGLDPDTLSICVRLCEAGINPEILAVVIKELQKEVTSINENSSGDTYNS